MPRAKPKPLKPGRTEVQITEQVLDAARLYGLPLERRNVGMAVGAGGKPVRFGTPGEPDYACVVPAGPNRGRLLACEIKHSLFDPRKLRGKKADHFARQRAAIRKINDAGGLALWVCDGEQAANVFRRVTATPGLVIEIDDAGFCWMEYPDQDR